MGLFKNIGNALKTATKRKEGGTTGGNLLRVAANSVSSGLLGNGVMMLKSGQSTDDNNALAIQALKDAAYNAGAGITIGNKLNGGKAMDDDFQQKTKSSALKIVGYVVGGIFTLVLVIFGIKKLSKPSTQNKRK